MPTAIKCVFIFRDDSGTGWEEIHYWLSQSDNPNLADRVTNMINVIAPLRATMLSQDCVLIGVRASYPIENGTASLPKETFIRGTTGKDGVSSAISLAVLFVDGSSSKRKITHLRGFWDAVEVNGEYHPEAPGAEGFADRLNAWKDALIQANYGWPTRSTTASAKGEVTGYTSTTDGIVSFTLKEPGMPLDTVGKVVPVRFSKLNNSQSPLNETINVSVTDRTHVVSVNQIAAGPFTSKGRFNYRATSFVNYANVYNVKAGRRPQGRPFGQPPGRSRARPRY